jgi:hypothetical protein
MYVYSGSTIPAFKHHVTLFIRNDEYQVAENNTSVVSFTVAESGMLLWGKPTLQMFLKT